MGQLQKLINIGKKTEELLNEVGIFTKSDLKKIGAVDAWKMLRRKSPQKDICLCALYALVGALYDIKWNELPEDLKEAYVKNAK